MASPSVNPHPHIARGEYTSWKINIKPVYIHIKCLPDTRSPTLAFHHDLLLLLESVILEGCIGVDAFCRALDLRRGKIISPQVFCIL